MVVILVNFYEWMELSPKYKTKLQYWQPKEFLPVLAQSCGMGCGGCFQTWSSAWCQLIIWSWGRSAARMWLASLFYLYSSVSHISVSMSLWWPNFNIVIVFSHLGPNRVFMYPTSQGWHWNPVTEEIALPTLIVIQIFVPLCCELHFLYINPMKHVCTMVKLTPIGITHSIDSVQVYVLLRLELRFTW